MSKWTKFWDMNSGGGTKEPYDMIYIEAPEKEAKVIFYNRFGHNPERVSCTCCGEDYSIGEYDSLEQASGYHRNCQHGYLDKDGNLVSDKVAWIKGKGLKKGYSCGYIERPAIGLFSHGKYQTLKQYEKNKDMLIIRAKDIKPEERVGDIPNQGYVWID